MIFRQSSRIGCDTKIVHDPRFSFVGSRVRQWLEVVFLRDTPVQSLDQTLEVSCVRLAAQRIIFWRRNLASDYWTHGECDLRPRSWACKEFVCVLHAACSSLRPESSTCTRPGSMTFREFLKFLAGSISALSKRNFARKYTFDSIFQALQTVHTFAPLQ